MTYTVGYMRHPTPEDRQHRANAGDLLRRAREAMGMTQEELAEAIGVSRGTILSYERGGTGLAVEQLPAIQQATELTPHALAYPPPKSETVAADLGQYLQAVARSAAGPLEEPGEEAEAQERSRHARLTNGESGAPRVPREKAG